MNAWVWYFASGRSFWAGLGLIGLALLLYLLLFESGFRRVSAIAYFGGILFVYLSVTPLAWFVTMLIWVLSFAWLFITLIRRQTLTFSLPLVCGTIFTAAIVALLEFPFHRIPSIPKLEFESIYVVGDSVSSGIGGPTETPWPKRLEEHLDRPIINLAVAGATAQTALQRQLPKITHENSLVFLEIGGNDLLNGTVPEDYETVLGNLLERLRQQNHTIVWFELPRLVWHQQQGQIQRQLSQKYGVILIPRTFLADIFKGKELTSDAIHLTQRGHDVFAEKVFALFERSEDGY